MSKLSRKKKLKRARRKENALASGRGKPARNFTRKKPTQDEPAYLICQKKPLKERAQEDVGIIGATIPQSGSNLTTKTIYEDEFIAGKAVWNGEAFVEFHIENKKGIDISNRADTAMRVARIEEALSKELSKIEQSGQKPKQLLCA